MQLCDLVDCSVSPSDSKLTISKDEHSLHRPARSVVLLLDGSFHGREKVFRGDRVGRVRKFELKEENIRLAA